MMGCLCRCGDLGGGFGLLVRVRGERWLGRRDRVLRVGRRG